MPVDQTVTVWIKIEMNKKFKGEGAMGKMKFICAVIVGSVAAADVLWAFLGEKIIMLSASLNSFKDDFKTVDGGLS